MVVQSKVSDAHHILVYATTQSDMVLGIQAAYRLIPPSNTQKINKILNTNWCPTYMI